MSRRAATRLSAPVAHHGEGALWDARSSRVVWVDMLAGRVLTTGLDGSTDAHPLPDSIAAFVRPIQDSDDFVVVGERTVWRVNLDDDGSPEAVVRLPIPAGARSNDGSCSPDGTLFVGTMAYDAHAGGGDVLACAGSDVTVALAGTTISNGQQFLDDANVVFVDSAERRIRSYRVSADSTWGDPQDVATVDADAGVPDGLCVDSEGGVWVALWDGGRAQRFDAQGRLTDEVMIPVPRPTSVCLGGPAMRTLFITTSALDQPDASGLGAGALFCVDVEIAGVAPCAWKLTGPAAPDPVGFGDG